MTTVREAFAEFLLDSEADGLTARTRNWYADTLKVFLDQHGGRALPTIDHTTVRNYVLKVRRDAVSAYTARAKISALLRFFGWANERYGGANPTAGIRRPKMPEPEPKAITANDLLAMFRATYERDTATADRDRALLVFMADTGVRSAGARTLKVENVDIARRRAIVTEKGARSRSVPYTQLTARLLSLWLVRRPVNFATVFCTRDGQALTHSGLRQLFERLGAAAGIEGRHNPHSLRHFAAREYLRNGGDLATAARLLGHSNIRTTAGYYARFDDDEVADRHDAHSPLKSMFKHKEDEEPI